MAYAPSAIQQLFAAVQARIPAARLGGIVGDQAHSFGYHLARNELPAGDYSVQLPPDRLGDAGAASALDVTLPPDLMIACTRRLVAAAKARDPRLSALREFCGTTDGTTTHNYDLASGYEGFNEWDASHLWHIHLSIYRLHAETTAILLPIADVLAGRPTPSAPTELGDNDMATLFYLEGDDGKPDQALHLLDTGSLVLLCKDNSSAAEAPKIGLRKADYDNLRARAVNK